MVNPIDLENEDKEIFDAIEGEYNREQFSTELIASENFASKAVLQAQGSILTNKYAEGYPSKRYYGGCEYVDIIETLAQERLKKLFNVNYVNVQPHSGSQANMAAIRTLVEKGDTIMGMSVSAGGHLSHGYFLSFSGQDYNSISYEVNKDTFLLDYDQIQQQVLEIKPKLIICGCSAYPRVVDFKRFKEIADSVGAYLIADIAHIAGLVCTGLHPSPIPYADIVTSTTHKTLRGPRGGIMMTNNEEIAKKMNKVVFPGVQGGPLEHVIAAKAVAFKEDLQPEYKTYMENVVINAKAMANEFINMGYDVLTNGTDNHLFLLDVYKSKGITGLQTQKLLEQVNITANKNSLPFDQLKPFIASGIRIGTPAMTTRGYSKEDFILIAHLIDEAIKNKDDLAQLDAIKEKVIELNKKHPLNY